MSRLLRFLALLFIKLASQLFFRVSLRWVGEVPRDRFRGIRIIALLNHTSLFEPIFIAVMPVRLLWELAGHGVIPGADITLNRPLAGRFFKALASNVMTITRQRDATWEAFLAAISDRTLILLAPEGRMARRNGLDKEGQPMTVRGGIADILSRVRQGRMCLAYSGGLHHVHAPGDPFPRFFKRVHLALEVVDIAGYIAGLGGDADARAFKRAVIADLERRRDEFRPR